MENKKIKLGVIASSMTLINCARRIAEERHEDIRFSFKSFAEAIPVGLEMEKAGVEAIVSRGLGSQFLKENLQIPVLSIPLTSLDILTSIKQAAPLGKRILLVIFRDKISGIKIFEELFNVELTQGIYYDKDTLEDVIVSAKYDGYEVVIGGGNSVQIAQRNGLPAVELQVSTETVLSIIEDAKAIAKSRRDDRKRTELYQDIIDSTSEGIIAVDVSGKITTINKTAKAVLRISDRDVIGEPITNHLPKAHILEVLRTERPILNKLDKINHDHYLSNNTPIILDGEIAGGVFSFKDISNVMRAENEVRRYLVKGLVAKYRLSDLIWKSKAMRDVVHKAKYFAESGSTLLISGETGTGKEILAHSIHELSQRKKGPFISLNCGALPDQLLESELFGHEEGSFTGARKGGKPGFFELAHHGTIFLDEIGGTPLSFQSRLLRIIQEKEAMRIGGDRLIPIDVRVIVATNKNLRDEVNNGGMREDLYFRLNVLSINIPPLRERIEDIPLLVNEFIRRASNKYNIKTLEIPDSTIEKLMQYHWPGNVRQLENFVEKLVLLSNPEFSLEIFDELFLELIEYSSMKIEELSSPYLKEYLHFKNRQNESIIISKALEDADYCKSKAAQNLGISRSTLWRKLKNGLVDI